MFDPNSNSENQELVQEISGPRERLVIWCLYGNGGEATLNELSRQLVICETEEVDDVTEEDVEHMHVLLEYIYVPLLENRNIIEYDRSEQVVRLQNDIREFLLSTQQYPRRKRRWALYYTVMGFGLAGVVLAYEFPPLQVSSTALSSAILVVVLSFLVLTILKHHDQLRNSRG